jgi:hypothetical protein
MDWDSNHEFPRGPTTRCQYLYTNFMFQTCISIWKLLIIAYSTAMGVIERMYTLWTNKQLHIYYIINMLLV